MTTTRRTRWRWLARWICMGAAALVLVLAVTGWMLLQHIPSWYTPAQVSAAELQRVRDELLQTFDALSEGMNGDRSFEFRVTQDQLNRWLAAREQIWPPAQEWVPTTMEDPFVGFEPDRIVLAGTVAMGGMRAVLSASVRLGVDGRGLTIRVFGVRGGSLAVPDALVKEQLRQIDARRRAREEPMARLPPAENLIAGTHVPAEFVFPNGKRRFRIREVRMQQGAITFGIEPLPRRHRIDE